MEITSESEDLSPIIWGRELEESSYPRGKTKKRERRRRRIIKKGNRGGK